jgi:hypothetical protein
MKMRRQFRRGQYSIASVSSGRPLLQRVSLSRALSRRAAKGLGRGILRREQPRGNEVAEAMKFKVPPDWQLTLVLTGLAVGLLALLVIELAERYPLSWAGRYGRIKPIT